MKCIDLQNALSRILSAFGDIVENSARRTLYTVKKNLNSFQGCLKNQIVSSKQTPINIIYLAVSGVQTSSEMHFNFIRVGVLGWFSCVGFFGLVLVVLIFFFF